MPNKLEKELRTQNKTKQDKKTELSGKLGVRINDLDVVEVPNRSGFHYVYLNENSELIQAFNDKTSPIFGLPVIVVWNISRYEVQEIDKRKYGTWNSNYLPKHGNQHSFNPDGGGAGDVAFIYGKQFVPLSLTPSGTFGAPVAIIAPYSQLQGAWHYISATTTPNIVAHKPTDNQAKMVLVCMDWDTRTPQIIVGSSSFSSTLTGSADVIPYLPIPTGINQVPIAGVRLVSGSTVVTWQNIYDVRQFFHPVITGSTGGGGGGGGTGNFVPYVGANSTVDLNSQNFLTTGTSRLGNTQIREGYFLQIGWNASYSEFPDSTAPPLPIPTKSFLGFGDGDKPFLRLQERYDDSFAVSVNRGTGTVFGAGWDAGHNHIIGQLGDIEGQDHKVFLEVGFTGTMVKRIGFPNQDFYINLSGTAHSNGVPLVKEAPADGLSYVRQNRGWVVAGTGTSSGGSGGTVGSIGIVGWDEGVYQATGTVLNVTGQRATLSASGTVLNLIISPDPQELIGVYAWDDGVPIGTGTIINFGNNLTATLSGTVLRIDSSASGTNYLQNLLDVSFTGLQNDDIIVFNSGTGKWENVHPESDAPFDGRIYGRQTGTWVPITGSSSGGGGSTGISGIAIYDDGVFIATGTSISFNTNLSVSASGTSITVAAPITTYFRVGQPTQLSGNFWRVPDQVYASGSLGIFNNGHALTPGVDYVEQIYVSGTYQYLSNFTGTHLAMYGVPCSPQTHIPTGSSSQFDLLDSNSISLLDSNGIQLLDSNG